MTISQTTVDELTQATLLDTVDQVIEHFFDWQYQGMKMLKHMHDVPESTVLEVDGVSISLEGDTRKAFQAGVALALSFISDAPFQTAESEEVNTHEAPETDQ